MQPKCILFKMPVPPTDTNLGELAKSVPWAANCLECQLRKDGKLVKMCCKSL